MNTKTTDSGYLANQPPSIATVNPCIYDEAGEAR